MWVLDLHGSCQFWLVLGAVEHKLFVGSLNKQALEKEIEEVKLESTIAGASSACLILFSVATELFAS